MGEVPNVPCRYFYNIHVDINIMINICSHVVRLHMSHVDFKKWSCHLVTGCVPRNFHAVFLRVAVVAGIHKRQNINNSYEC